ncbi:enhancer of split m7 protein-like [Engraulis encrasicolus]|uniref:enhancer of split m7 protein-like n=1 Tax=Engraulis encrasicolus TaxID=184585 RepID=UPI002FD72CE0
MSPNTVSLLPSYDGLSLSDKERIKLRKPLVEKMRRDRINSCIEQLKSLLETEFHSQDPNAKLEKADILEMTVSFLKRQRLHLGPLGVGVGSLGQRDYDSCDGYSSFPPPQPWSKESDVVCGSGSPSEMVVMTTGSSQSQARTRMRSLISEPHSPPRSPRRDIVLSSSSSYSSSSSSSSSPCPSPSSDLSMSPPVITKHNLVSVIHHAAGRRCMWRPWQ